MTFFLDGPTQKPLRRAEDVPSVPQLGMNPTEDTMANNRSTGGSERMRDVLRAAAPLNVHLDELVDAYGGPRTAARTRLNSMVRSGLVKKFEGQRYKWIGEVDAQQEPEQEQTEELQEEEAGDVSEDTAQAEEEPAELEEAYVPLEAEPDRRPVRVRFVSFEVEGELDSVQLAAFLEQLRTAVER